MSSISPRFVRRIRTHLLSNLIRDPLPGTPVILAIHGEPGTGKSFQLDAALVAAQVLYRTISSSDLESDRANDPAKLVRSTYLELSDEVSSKGYLAGALVLNDIDTALGDWGDLVQTTVNRQLVIGELQHISDYPSTVANRPNLRLPIFITANDLTKLYGPLLRPGRTARFHWEPTFDEVEEILRPLLPSLTSSELHAFVERAGSHSVATYVDAMRAAHEKKMECLIENFGDSLTKARLGQLEELAAYSLEDLLEALDAIHREATLTANYVGAADDQH